MKTTTKTGRRSAPPSCRAAAPASTAISCSARPTGSAAGCSRPWVVRWSAPSRTWPASWKACATSNPGPAAPCSWSWATRRSSTSGPPGRRWTTCSSARCGSGPALATWRGRRRRCARTTGRSGWQSRCGRSGRRACGAFRRPLGAELGDLLQGDRSRTHRAPQGTPLGHPVEIREPRLAPDLYLHPGVVTLAGAGADGQLGVEPVGLHPGVGKGREVLAVAGPALGHLSGREPGVVAWGVFLDRQAGKLLVQWGELARDRGGGAGAEGRDERRRGKKLAMHNVWSAV